MADRGRKAFPVTSQLLDDKWNQQNHKMHRDRLNAMKKRIDNNEPASTGLHPNKNGNGKKIQKAIERQVEIDLENQILLDKMVRIKTEDTKPMFRPFLARSGFKLQSGLYYDTMTNRKCIDHHNVPASHVSILHQQDSNGPTGDFRKQQQWVNTVHENSKLLRAIDGVKPNYDNGRFEKEHAANCAHSARLSKFRGPDRARYTPAGHTPPLSAPRFNYYGADYSPLDLMSASPTGRPPLGLRSAGSVRSTPPSMLSQRRAGSAEPLRPTLSRSNSANSASRQSAAGVAKPAASGGGSQAGSSRSTQPPPVLKKAASVSGGSVRSEPVDEEDVPDAGSGAEEDGDGAYEDDEFEDDGGTADEASARVAAETAGGESAGEKDPYEEEEAEEEREESSAEVGRAAGRAPEKDDDEASQQGGEKEEEEDDGEQEQEEDEEAEAEQEPTSTSMAEEEEQDDIVSELQQRTSSASRGGAAPPPRARSRADSRASVASSSGGGSAASDGGNGPAPSTSPPLSGASTPRSSFRSAAIPASVLAASEMEMAEGRVSSVSSVQQSMPSYSPQSSISRMAYNGVPVRSSVGGSVADDDDGDDGSVSVAFSTSRLQVHSANRDSISDSGLGVATAARPRSASGSVRNSVADDDSVVSSELSYTGLPEESADAKPDR